MESGGAAKSKCDQRNQSVEGIQVDRLTWRVTSGEPTSCAKSRCRSSPQSRGRRQQLRINADFALLRLCEAPHKRKNWLFCSSEIGAKQLSTTQTVLATCRCHDVDPYTWLVDVLQRIKEPPASRVAELAPREWARRYAANPLRSDLASIGQ